MISQFDTSNYDLEESLPDDENDNYVIDCQFRSVSDTEFIVPSNVNFTDFSEMMDDIPSFDAYDYTDEEAPMFDEEEMARLEQWAQEMQEKYGDME